MEKIKELSADELFGINGGGAVEFFWWFVGVCTGGAAWDIAGHWGSTRDSLKKGADEANSFWDKQ